MKIANLIKILAGLLMVTLAACKESSDLEYTQDRTDAFIKGQFITREPETVDFPVKVLFAIDCSLSMGQSVNDADDGGADPDNKRIQAVRDFIAEFGDVESVSFSVLLWNTSVFARTIRDDGSNKAGFTRNMPHINSILDRANNDSQTNYLGTIAEIDSIIEEDIKDTDGETLQRTKYVVIFLSDGIPQILVNGQNVIQEQTDIVQAMYEMRNMTERADVNGFEFHTFLLRGAISQDETSIILRYARQVLQGMSDAANGLFTEFQDADSIGFLSFINLQLAVDYIVKYAIAYNVNTIPELEVMALDSDGDGLSDEEELDLGTDPICKDTDGDGASDYIELKLRSQNRDFDPLLAVRVDAQDDKKTYPDNNCTAGINNIWPDTDGDMLTDCEEREDMLGTNPRIADTDGDGVPDGLEVLAGTDPLVQDDTSDSDYDGYSNTYEIRRHTNLHVNDPKLHERYSYDYKLVDHGQVVVTPIVDNRLQLPTNRKIYTLEVSNLDILDVGINPRTGEPHPVRNPDCVDAVRGENTIQVYIAQVPENNPNSAPYYSKVEFKVNIDAGKNPSGNKVMEFHSDELFTQSGPFSVSLNELN